MSGVSAGPYTHRHPFAGARISSYRITPPDAPKDTQHHVVSLAGSGLKYRPGDALGVWPRNPDSLVDAILARLGATGDEMVTAGHGETLPFREALATQWDLALPSRRLLDACLAQGAEMFRPLLQKGRRGTAEALPAARGTTSTTCSTCCTTRRTRSSRPSEFGGLMRALQPRLYSIASSELRHPEEAHLLVLAVTYPSRGRERLGVASTFINDRWPQGTTAPVYLQDAQKHFAMPADPATPMIMIGPGTGLAPFRGFLEERDALGATGRNWLFFGDQARSWGFYYEEELTAWAAARLPPAGSRLLARPAAEDLRPAPHARKREGLLRVAGGRGRESSSAATRERWPPTSSANWPTSSRPKVAARQNRPRSTSRR